MTVLKHPLQNRKDYFINVDSSDKVLFDVLFCLVFLLLLLFISRMRFESKIIFFFFPSKILLFASPIAIRVLLTVIKVIIIANDLDASNIIKMAQLDCFT